MPVADFRTYCKMLDRAKENRFAYPAINVSSLTTANAVLRGLAESRSDGIIQVSTGGAAFASGSSVKDMVLGAISIAEHVHRVAARYDIYVALHTDHCQAPLVERFLVPLVKETERRRQAGLPNLFNSHMFDGSALPLKENLDIAVPLLERCHRNELILEVEAGVVGGEEDGIKAESASAEKLYTTPEDMLEVARRLGGVKGARFLLAATFGNVHGVYKPGHVKLKPAILKAGQDAVEQAYGKEARFDLVFHGGSGSLPEEIHEAIDYGVVKMNIDTDLQWALWEGIKNYYVKNEGYLQGQIGNPEGPDEPNKKYYDPRAWLRKGEESFKARLKLAFEELGYVKA